MKMEDATRFAEKCFNGEPASCSYACPFHLDIRTFLDKAGKGRWTAAYKQLANSVVFPAVVSMLCEQPCRECCQRTVLGDEAIAIRDIEASVLRYAKNRKPEAYFISPKSQKIAVVGAGVAGLSCALNLSQKKYLVTVYEKGGQWGGRLREHPRFEEFDEELRLRFSAVDVDFIYNSEIKSMKELDVFDAVYIASGRDGNFFGLFDSWDSRLLTTADPKVFMGGELCGASLMEAIAQGTELSKTMEVFLQTGKASATHDHYDKRDCGHYLKHEGVVPAPLVQASADDGYTEEEAKQEAARCLMCDCELCLTECEMLKRFKKKPHRIAVEVFTDSQSVSLAGRSLTRETYSCNICGYCKSICPESVDMGELLQFSRAARNSAGIQPSALHDFWLREMDFASGEGAFALEQRDGNAWKYVFFPGCQLGAANPEYVLDSYEILTQKRDTGIILNCCGAPAYWAGDEKRLALHMDRLKQTWNHMGKPVLIFACATCESMIQKFLPEIGGVSLYELLSEEIDMIPTSRYQKAAVFDPCSARKDNAMEHGVRKLARKAGIELRELKDRNRCCGYGGHMKVANPSLYEEIADNRAKAAEEPYIVYCVNCREVFASREKDCTHVLDLVFDYDRESRIPSLQEKRENSLNVKKELMKKIAGIDFTPEVHPWDEMKLMIGNELQKSLDQKLISAFDIKEAVWQAEDTGDRFIDESDGTNLCCLMRDVMTYWVQYKRIKADTFEIISAYSHRMRFHREE